MRESKRCSAERDWVYDTLSGDAIRSPQRLKNNRSMETFLDSSIELREGLDLIEHDTIPAELLDHFENM